MFLKNQMITEKLNIVLTDTLSVPYVQGASDRLRRKLAQKGVNVIFKRGQTLGKYLINFGPPRNTRRKNVVYKIPCETCNFCYIGETSQWILVKLHSGLMRERTSTSAASGIVIQTMEFTCAC